METQWALPGYTLERVTLRSDRREVWRARDAAGEAVTVKRLIGCDAWLRDPLRRDAAALSSVAGDHLVRVRDVVVVDSAVVIVTDVASGGTLAEVVAARGRLPAPQVVTVVGPLAAVLADAHGRGLVHGDLTRDCIGFTADGRPLLDDFGVAHVVAAPGDAPPSPADDVFALCTVATEALLADSAPAALVAALDHGLAADPDDRPTARQLSLAVLRSCAAAPVAIVAAETPAAAPVVVPQPAVSAAGPAADDPRVARRSSRPRLVPPRQLPVPRRVVAAALAVAALAAAVSAGVAWGHRDRPAAAVLPPAAARPGASPDVRPSSPARRPAPSWSATVARLAALRAGAFDRGDGRMLRRVYVPDAPPLRADITTLRRLAGLGLRVQSFRIALGSVRLVMASAAEVVLRVTDRLSSYRLVGGLGRVVRTVPARGARTWTMTLRRVGAEWRIARVSR